MLAQFQADFFRNAADAIQDGSEEFNPFHAPPEPKDKNGEAKLVVRKTGIFLHIIPPKGNGKPTTIEQANTELFMRGIMNYDKSLVEQAVSANNGEPVRLGDWQPNPQFDSRVNLEINS